MDHGPGASPAAPTAASPVEKILPFMSIATMVMTLPQIWTIWVDQQVAGVSLLSWGTYLAGACLWFVHGLHKRDKTIYVACIGWILLNGAVVAGVLLHR
ncbi:hypothetical protein JI739_20895 [Ramlibacter sp. AW1]|uniref:Uncharacterized protein n=1 Tax=Ramlibacter aurantiacus TaxID=2801330 RepID=A0A936ZSD7_9BURK|nr:PQ-loop domain-containing transporter [Ramlibacter aurantiacus]MBL0422806.1 hypothetical protein [Ramlibacter aurantiacus]